MHEYTCDSKDRFLAINGSAEFQDRYALQLHMAKIHQEVDRFELSGLCVVCGRPSQFSVDWVHSCEQHGGVRVPNWRERLDCTGCGLNNRQRGVAHYLLDAVRRIGHRGKPRIYMTEQVTPFYRVMAKLLGRRVKLTGSEYIPDGLPSDAPPGIHHEDILALSFPDGAFDLVVSNDVLEHVPDPERAFAELARVLDDGGTLLMTIPFRPDRDGTTARARIENGSIVHLTEPWYHGNPVSEQGSLVFWDFGWDVLATARRAGFRHARCVLYWSMEYCYLGGPLPMFLLER